MMKVPGNQFLTDYDLVAKEMNCLKGLLYQLHKISNLGNSFKTNNDLIWNKDCRYCARTYFDDEVWLGLYFDIKGNYTFILGFETESDCTKMEQKLKDNHQQYFYKHFKIDEKTEEDWLCIELDKFILFCDCVNQKGYLAIDEIKDMITKYHN